MKSIEIVNGVYWVGAIDWDLRDYHGYTLPGTTYNAYLVVGDDKIALIDSAYPGFDDQIIERVRSVVDPKEIDVLIGNHVEVDHSGTLPALTKMLPGVPIYCTANGKTGFQKHYDTKDWNFHVVKSGDTLDLGGKTLAFLEAPLLHWPDSMFTYYAEEKILFPNDAFGQHIASSERFDDELGRDVALKEAQKFYGNLITPLAPRVLKKLEEVGSLGIVINMIAPSHGVIWRSYASDIVNAYLNWSKGASKDKVTIVYDSMHGSTGTLAKAFAEGIMEEGVEVKVCLLKDGKSEGTHRSNIMADVLDSKALLVGSPNLQNQLYPTVADFLSYLKGLKPGKLGKKKLGFAFGSHGGSVVAIKLISADLKAAGIDVINDGFGVQYRPESADLERATELGRDLARRVKAL
ncbi:FprA family A-type flavoprotein [Methanomassiliicoccus luminyensis]|uniref:FprA family A-type flavoprotein n=1 Tax=Methanomassiliicoccus luminyensis TaxID=1080712 RepID=UPI0004745C6A